MFIIIVGELLLNGEESNMASAANVDELFKCPTCFRPFNRKDNLMRHELIHSGEKEFACKVCGKIFKRRDAMVRHQKIHERNQAAVDVVHDDGANGNDIDGDTTTTTSKGKYL